MKKYLHLFCFFLVLILQVTWLKSQNLVPNPSFEEYDTCPNNAFQIQYAIGWKNCWDIDHWSSPDYFNSCSPAISGGFSVPNNFAGYQLAADGVAYAGIYTFEKPSVNFTGEYIGTQLLSPLAIGTKYYFSFKANLALDTNHIFTQATNNLGLLLSTTDHSINSNPIQINNYAHIYSTSVIYDTLNWTTISGSFIADSAYQFIIIGRFFDDGHTTVVQMQNVISDSSSYYYIDQVYVSIDSIPSELYDKNIEDKIRIYPNPFSDSIMIENNYHFSPNNTHATLYDASGTEKRKYSIVNPTTIINKEDLAAGIYLLRVQIDDIVFAKKIIIQ